MNKRRILLGIFVAVASLAVLITLFSWFYFPVQADETDVAWVAKQVSVGRIPYADFFSFIPPGALYLLGSYFRLTGPSLGALRLLTILLLVIMTLILYLLFTRKGLHYGWAVPAALSVPCIYLPFWPVPSHHWFAMTFGLAALLALDRKGNKAIDWLVGGILVGMSGMCLQTEGLFFFLFCLPLLCFDSNGRKGQKALAYCAGTAFPALLFSLILLISGAFGWAVYDIIKWPARFYKQVGGFNDINPIIFIGNQMLALIPKSLTPGSLAPLFLFIVALMVPLSAVFLPAFSPDWFSPEGRKASARWITSSWGLFLVFAIYLRGRADWTHLCLWTPVLLLMTVRIIDWDSEKIRPALFKAWLVGVLIISSIRWPMVWVKEPPVIHKVMEVDAIYVRHGLPAILNEIPGAKERGEPIIYLGKAGSALYFYWAPIPPPLDWIMPPSSRYNSRWEYGMLSDFARKNRVPWIVIPVKYHKAFTEEPSAVSSLLKSDYTLFKQTGLSVIYKRK